jgi:hypothetical protein
MSLAACDSTRILGKMERDLMAGTIATASGYSDGGSANG